jgi:hypothetical protein
MPRQIIQQHIRAGREAHDERPLATCRDQHGRSHGGRDGLVAAQAERFPEASGPHDQQRMRDRAEVPNDDPDTARWNHADGWDDAPLRDINPQRCGSWGRRSAGETRQHAGHETRYGQTNNQTATRHGQSMDETDDRCTSQKSSALHTCRTPRDKVERGLMTGWALQAEVFLG